jgi:hypothetical protein
VSPSSNSFPDHSQKCPLAEDRPVFRPPGIYLVEQPVAARAAGALHRSENGTYDRRDGHPGASGRRSPALILVLTAVAFSMVGIAIATAVFSAHGHLGSRPA